MVGTRKGPLLLGHALVSKPAKQKGFSNKCILESSSSRCLVKKGGFGAWINMANTSALRNSQWVGILNITCITSIRFGFKFWVSVFIFLIIYAFIQYLLKSSHSPNSPGKLGIYLIQEEQSCFKVSCGKNWLAHEEFWSPSLLHGATAEN